MFDFTNMLVRGFYMHRSQKRKKRVKSSVYLCDFGIHGQQAACNSFMKWTSGLDKYLN